MCELRCSRVVYGGWPSRNVGDVEGERAHFPHSQDLEN